MLYIGKRSLQRAQEVSTTCSMELITASNQHAVDDQAIPHSST